jgi:hypothetical protein
MRAEDLKAFDSVVDNLRSLERAGWIGLEVTAGGRRKVDSYNVRYIAATGTCTDRARELLQRLEGDV